MNDPSRSSRRAGPSPAARGLAMVVGLLGGPATAQDVEEAAAPAPPVPAVTQASFHRWVFGSDREEGAAIDRLDRVLAARVGDLERTCGLTPAQQAKLLLAGRVDVERFRARVAEARSSFDRWRWDRTNLAAIRAEAEPLGEALAGDFFGEGSIFAKTVEMTLDQAQRDHRRDVLAGRAARRHQARVGLAVADLAAKVGLAADQAERFAAVVLAETPPPARPAGAFASKLVLYQIASIPADKLRPIFDDYQWRALSRRLVDIRADEPSFRALGLLDRPDAPPAARPN